MNTNSDGPGLPSHCVKASGPCDFSTAPLVISNDTQDRGPVTNLKSAQRSPVMNKTTSSEPSSETPHRQNQSRTYATEPELEPVLKFRGVYCYVIKPVAPTEPIDQAPEKLPYDR
jgi:hypothetical protein